MKKRHRLFLLFLLALLLPVLPASAEGTVPDPASIPGNGSPYYIAVNRQCNTVTVYTLDENGCYGLPLLAMVCSTGREGMATPLGTYAVTGVKSAWNYMLDGSYGQYATQFHGNYLFHSVCYARNDPGTLLTEEYNLLGQRASMGCVRLQTVDAKWIFDNCPAGTGVAVYDGEVPGPLGKPAALMPCIPPELDWGWDPTDPREENPWNGLTALPETEQITLTAGDRAASVRLLLPDGTALPRGTLHWTSWAPAVADVDPEGWIVGRSPGTTVLTGSFGPLQASCEVTVTGELLPFADVPPGTWYYSGVRFAVAHDLMEEAAPGLFAPEAPADLGAALRALWLLSGAEGTPDALTWATGAGLLEGVEDPAPSAILTRQEFAALLYRFAALRGIPTDRAADLGLFSDALEAAPRAVRPLSWAVANGLIQGTDSRLFPDQPLTRAQLAVLLQRFAG